MSARVAAAVLAGLIALPTASAQSPFPDHVKPTFTVMSIEMALGDVDGDGFLDLALPVPEVLMNRGDGTFPDIAAGFAGPLNGVALGDVDGDGEPDLLTTNRTNQTLDVHLGDGSGGFATAVSYGTPQEPQEIGLGDFDGDGDLDAAVPAALANRVRVFLNAGDGTFPVTATHAVGDGSDSIAVADVDGDGDLDLVVGNRYGDTVSVLLGHGDGTFAAPVDYAAPSPANARVGDADNDGVLDVVVGIADVTESSVAILPGAGDGTFGAPVLVPVGGQYVVSAEIADMDEDGLNDLVGTVAIGDRVAVLLGRADGTFEAPRLYGAGSNPQALVVADVDMDGNLDVVVNTLDSKEITTLLGHGDGELRNHYVMPDRPQVVAAGDFTDDGITDVIATTDSAVLGVLEGVGDGHLRGPITSSGGPAVDLVAGDFDEDGQLDIAYTASTNVTLQRGVGDGTFGAPEVTVLPATNAFHLLADDINGDTHLDLLVSYGAPRKVRLLPGNGDGTFGAPVNVVNATGRHGVGDVDGDGVLDLVALEAGSVVLRLGNGGGVYQPAISFATAAFADDAFVIADLDGDGDDDLALQGFQEILIALSHGDGTFAAETGFPMPWLHVSEIVSGDFDADGDVDLLTGHGPFDQVIVLPNNGDGTFAGALLHRLGGEPRGAVTAADLNGDRVPDAAFPIILPGSDLQHVAVLLSNAGPWRNLGHPLAGGGGTPTLVSIGSLQDDSPIRHVLDDTAPFASLYFVLGVSELGAPFKGGVLVPFPDFVVGGLPADADGHFEINALWPAGIPSGVQLYHQFWMPDAAGPVDFAASNAIEGTVP